MVSSRVERCGCDSVLEDSRLRVWSDVVGSNRVWSRAGSLDCGCYPGLEDQIEGVGGLRKVRLRV